MERSLRIIAADDELLIREYYQQALPALGHEVVAIVDTGAELIEKCRSLTPDLVITDIKMPDMDGINAAARSTTTTHCRSFWFPGTTIPIWSSGRRPSTSWLTC